MCNRFTNTWSEHSQPYSTTNYTPPNRIANVFADAFADNCTVVCTNTIADVLTNYITNTCSHDTNPECDTI